MKTGAQTKNIARDAKAVELRAEGKTHREIASEIGVSVPRVAQILYERVADAETPMELSVRALNQINNVLWDKRVTNRTYHPDPDKVARLLPQIHAVRPNGKKAILEIIAWLRSKGIITRYDPTGGGDDQTGRRIDGDDSASPAVSL